MRREEFRGGFKTPLSSYYALVVPRLAECRVIECNVLNMDLSFTFRHLNGMHYTCSFDSGFPAPESSTMMSVTSPATHDPTLLVHGGAWAIPADAAEAHERGVRAALDAGYAILSLG